MRPTPPSASSAAACTGRSTTRASSSGAGGPTSARRTVGTTRTWTPRSTPMWPGGAYPASRQRRRVAGCPPSGARRRSRRSPSARRRCKWRWVSSRWSSCRRRPTTVRAAARFFDFGTNRAAGWRLRVPNGTGTAWGGHGTRLEIRLGEALSAEGARTIAWANPIDAFFNGWPTSARRASQPLAPSLSRHATFTVLRAGLPSARRCIHHSYRPAFFCVRDGVVPRSHAAGT
mmetsp:Transcript_74303/g.204711  ORF Transcript_74303/g.204711 Transcript_74303/m.204711 type:complete len:231 (+) Transcript_74303:600-1292(+)